MTYTSFDLHKLVTSKIYNLTYTSKFTILWVVRHQRSHVAPHEVRTVLHDFLYSWKYAFQRRSTNVSVVHPDILQDRYSVR